MKNQYPGTCNYCGAEVPAGEGRLLQFTGANSYLRRTVSTFRTRKGRRYALRCVECEKKNGSFRQPKTPINDGEARLRLIESCGGSASQL